MRKSGFDLDEVRAFMWEKRQQKKKGVRDLIEKDKKILRVKLHGNEIASLNPKRNVLNISSAGWQTNTTKTRLNKILFGTGYNVSQKNYSWYLGTPSGKKVPFKDNMRINLNRSRQGLKYGKIKNISEGRFEWDERFGDTIVGV